MPASTNPQPSGPLSDEEVNQFITVYNRPMGNVYENQAQKMAAARCQICDEWTLFADARKGQALTRTCGMFACDEAMRRRDEAEQQAA